MRTALACIALLMSGALVAGSGVRAGPAEEVRGVVAAWLGEYERTLATLVGTETYTQRAHKRDVSGEFRSTRVLASECAWVSVLSGRALVGVRAVRVVDGETVGPSGRLEALLRAPEADRGTQVAALLAESVRHLQVPLAINFNYPTFPLQYLHQRDARGGMRWSVRDGRAADTAELRFRESGAALVRTPDGRPVEANGSFIVDRQTGRVLESTVTLDDMRTSSGEASGRSGSEAGVEIARYRMRVRFGTDARLGVWVPLEMEDRYEWRRRASEIAGGELVIDGRAAYDGFRRFDTEVRVLP